MWESIWKLWDGISLFPVRHPPTYPIDRGRPAGVRKEKRAAMKRKNKRGKK